MMNRSLRLTFGLLFVALCALPGRASASSTHEASPAADQRQVSVYFLREGRRSDQVGAAHREVSASTDDAAARAAIQALIDGPNTLDQESGLSSAIPTATKILDLTLDPTSKTAKVDFSAAFAPDGAGVPITAMAQVVYTLTQFDGIEQTAIEVEGQPVTLLDGDGIAIDGPATRVHYDHTTPLIFLESPAPGDTIGSPVRLWGTANTFEATFQAEVQSADGTILVSEVVTATSGNGVRGTFDITLTFDPKGATSGQVVVFERSARDGRVENEVVIPVTFDVQE
jgi:Sporulation and spore germination/Immunoglobulin-like domain of bacterial spore germination